MAPMRKHVIWSLILIIIFIVLGYFLVRQERVGATYPFRFGLDLVGGTELVYQADTSDVEDVSGAMNTLKEVIERRVNIFGVSEPLVQTESAGIISGNALERLIVELPGVKDIELAKQLIGETPILEFRLQKPGAEEFMSTVATGTPVSLDDIFLPATLTGQYLSHAQVEFDPNTGIPLVALEFDSEGADLFSQITKENIVKPLSLILDGAILSSPVIQSEITGGKAQISGNFTAEEAKALVRNLNYGALPVPITLITSQTIGASLGDVALHAPQHEALHHRAR